MSILVPCAKPKDRDELSNKEDIIFNDFDSFSFKRILAGLQDTLPREHRPEFFLKHIHSLIDTHHITKLFNTLDYPGCIYTGIVGRERNMQVPDLKAILLCQHKYYARCAQKKIVPEATPHFALVRHDKLDEIKSLMFPLFIKPVKSYLSVFAQRISSMEELKAYLKRVKISEQFLLPFNWAIERYTDYAYDGSYFIAEEMLKGEQVTLEGYVHNGTVGMIGIVDSIMIGDTVSFERFVYPSRLPQEVQNKMFEIAQKFITSIGFDNSLFNIEFMYDEETDSVHIIEINPRMSGQFTDLFMWVNGVSNYEIQYDIVRGVEPTVIKQGEFNVAASLVQRQLKNMKVTSAPTQQHLDEARKKYPELRCYPWVKAGDKLSDVLQDGTSYVYNLLHLGANNEKDLQQKYDDCKRLLPFGFEPV